MTVKAVIVAAGLSSRLYPLTSETPKALLPLVDESLLSRSMRLLRASGIKEIAVVAGFRADVMRAAVGSQATIIINPFYRDCNNMGSLSMARHFVGGERFVYMHGDLAFGEGMLESFLGETAAEGDSCLDLLVDFGMVDDEAMKVRVDANNRLIESDKRIPLDDADGEWTGIALVRKPDIVFGAIERHMMTVSITDYDTAAFTELARDGSTVRCIPTNGEQWKEIDTLEDLESARSMIGARA
jgi:choline kinase